MASEQSEDCCPEALRQCASDLMKAIRAANILDLTWMLFAKKLVELDTIESCELQATATQKSSKIVGAVVKTISASPHLYESLISVLSESDNTALKSVGEKLKKSYEESSKELLIETSCHSHSFHIHHHCPPITPPHLQSLLFRYANYLKAVYKRYEFSNPACYKWMCSLGREFKFKFINLAVINKKEIIEEEEAEKIKRNAILGHIDVILEKKAPIAIENILQVEQGQSLTCVLVEGAPGVGKSTFASEVCNRWGKDELFQEYYIVQLVTLRDERVQKATCVADLFYHYDKELQEEVVKAIDITNGRGILILLEGLDELPIKHLLTNTIFTDLLSGAIFPEATILVTSRPSATDKLWQRWWQQTSRHIEILGFTEDNIDEYSKSVLKDHDQLLGFNNYLSIHPHIKSMMYVPLHCAIAITVYLQCQQSDRPPPKTLTGLYTCLAETIILQYLKDHPEYKCKFNSFLDLPTPVYTNFKRLCSLAFDGVAKQQLVFRNLPPTLEQFEHLGFLDAVPERLLLPQKSANYSYNFLHLSVQEYLAAYHVSLMSHHEQEQLLQTVSYGDHRFNMIRFLAGITQLKHLDKKVVKQAIGINDISKTKADISKHALEIIYECQDVSILDSMYCCHINIGPNDSVHLLMALGYSITKSSSKWHVKFLGRGSSGIDSLCNSLKENHHGDPTYSIECLEFTICVQDFPHQVLQHLSECALKQIKTIIIEDSRTHDRNPLPPCLPKLIPRMEGLNTLILKNILETSLTSLIPALSRVPTLRTLLLPKLNSEGIALLYRWLPTCKLEKLIIEKLDVCQDSPNATVLPCIDEIMTAIFNNHSIKSIECQDCATEFFDQILSQIPQQSIGNVEKLTIHNDIYRDSDYIQLPMPLCLPELILRMKRLDTLTLENVLDTSLTKLLPTLSRVPTLRELTLPKLNSECITLLCQWLPKYKLETLFICKKKSPSNNYVQMMRADFHNGSIDDIMFLNCTTEFIDQILSPVPQQSIAHVRTLTICNENKMMFTDEEKDRQLLPIPSCLPSVIPQMKRLSTLELKYVLDTSLTELIPALPRALTLRNLTLPKLNSEGFTLLYQCLSTCQLKKLIFSNRNKKVLNLLNEMMTATAILHNNSIEAIEFRHCTAEFIDEILSQVPQYLLAHIKTLMIYDKENEYKNTDKISCHLPSCLPELIPRMERLNTLILKKYFLDHISLLELIPVLSSVPTLRSLTLPKLNSEGIALLYHLLPKCQLENLTIWEEHQALRFTPPDQKMIMTICNNSIEGIEFQYCTPNFIDRILSQIPWQLIAQVKTFTIHNEKHRVQKPIMYEDKVDSHVHVFTQLYLEQYSRVMTLQNTLLTGMNVIDYTVLTKLIIVLSRVPTLRSLTLPKPNSEGIALLCEWLPTCQLEKLIIWDENQKFIFPITDTPQDQTMTMTICNNSIEGIEFQHCTTNFIYQILSQIPQQLMAQVKTLSMNYHHIHLQQRLPIPSCLGKMIPRMKRLNTLTLINILDTSLTQLIPALSRVSTLRNLTLHELNAEGFALLCQWLPTSQLKKLYISSPLFYYLLQGQRNWQTGV